MNKITDYGARGAEHLESYTAPKIQEIDPTFQSYVNIVKQFPKVNLEDDASDGSKRPLSAHALPIGNERVFELLHAFSVYEPLVYLGTNGQKASMGIMSPNHDDHGHSRNPDLKIIPLFTPYPLNVKGQYDLTPDARMMTMLAGAAHSESAGVGGHGDVDNDLEHRATILGAISIGDSSKAISHANHDVRRQNGSVVSSLSNGQLGNIFAPNTSENDFTGFGQPIVISKETAGKKDFVYIPESFVGSESAFGVTYKDADRIMLGAGLQALYSRNPDNGLGRSIVGDQIKNIAKKVKNGAH